ncbi:Magnesium transporter MgtE [Planctomycetales bacterium 10988]|nr:Magnesium transporter MgtE [Planctomycetales bacterium 10988]
MLNTLYLPELREMLANDDQQQLSEFCSTLHPARTAEYMEGLEAEESWRVLKTTDVATCIDIFTYFPREKQIDMLENLDRKEMAKLVADLPPDERVDLLAEVDPEVVEEVLPLMPAVERRDILRLQSYEEDTAGRVMTTEVARLSENLSIAEVQDRFRAWGENPEILETVYYLYVVDDDDHLRGVVSFREIAFAALVTHQKDKRIRDLMQPNVISVRVDQDQEEVARVFADHDLLALPVVDQRNRLIGIVTHDDVIDVVREEAVEDAHLSGGIQPLENGYLQTKLLSLAWKRVIWLTILFFAALLTATALNGYEPIMAQHVWLVMFIPLVISSGGNSGNQSATLVITALNNEDVHLHDWKRIIFREIMMGLLLGGALSGAALIVVWVMVQLGFAPPLAIFDSIVVPFTVFSVVIAGTLTGAILPLFFRRLGLDPALMSNPFVACVMDILGICIYMSIAQLVL